MQVQLELVRRHQEPHRAYHTLAHVQEMLQMQAQVGNRDKLLELAIWFHDAVYDPTGEENEERSAALARDLLKRELPETELNRLAGLILLTKRHERAEVRDEAGGLLLDLDLMVLGGDQASYEFYAAAIRQEYLHVPTEDYAKGRTAVLKRFLDRERLFWLLADFEETARQNLTREIETLARV